MANESSGRVFSIEYKLDLQKGCEATCQPGDVAELEAAERFMQDAKRRVVRPDDPAPRASGMLVVGECAGMLDGECRFSAICTWRYAQPQQLALPGA